MIDEQASDATFESGWDEVDEYIEAGLRMKQQSREDNEDLSEDVKPSVPSKADDDKPKRGRRPRKGKGNAAVHEGDADQKDKVLAFKVDNRFFIHFKSLCLIRGMSMQELLYNVVNDYLERNITDDMKAFGNSAPEKK